MKPELKQVKLSEIVFDESIYPRKEHSPSKVQEYAENIEAIENAGQYISLSANKKLLDGKHRYLAYRKLNDNQDIEIQAFIYEDVKTEYQEYQKGIDLNKFHGQNFTKQEKQDQCRKLYLRYGCSLEDIAKMVSCSKQFALDSTKSIREDEEKKQLEKIKEMYLACYTMDEIAEKVSRDKGTVENKINKFVENSSIEPNSTKYMNFQDEDFDIPIYNIWTFSKKTNETGHFGNTEQRIVDNLLYLYTKPFDIIVDPFGGGGSTIDICKKRLRRYFVSDRKPIVERKHEIRELDVTQSLPELNKRWSDVSLVYLDPPYWKQAEGQYSQDKEDLANQSLDEFNQNLSNIVNNFASKLKSGSHIALIIQPTQWKSENKKFTDHVFDMIKLCNNKKLSFKTRISCPYSTQQCTPQQVNWAKENKELLVLTRELIVWMMN